MPADPAVRDDWQVPVRRPRLYPVLAAIGRPLIRGLVTLLGGLRVEGCEHIPREGPVLVVANHQSYADPPLLAATFPRPLWFMANQAVFDIPFVGWISRHALAFPVVKEVAVDRAALRKAEAVLRSGEALCIFPEGGTTPDARLARFYSGAALVALRTGAPILPAGLIHTARLMPNLTWVPRYTPGGVTVRYGPVLSLADMPAGLGRREQADWVSARMWEGIAALLPPEHLPERPLMSTRDFVGTESPPPGA